MRKILISCALMMSLLGRPVAAAEINIQNGRIYGEAAQYAFDMPELWQSLVTAQREPIAQKENVLERFCVYFQPQTKNAKPVPVLRMQVYERARYTPDTRYHKLVETTHYVFEVQQFQNGNLTNYTDRALFELVAKKTADVRFLIEQLRLPADEELFFDDTVFVNGRMLRNRSLKYRDTTYLPVREVCEALGYKVTWLDANKAISISKDDFYRLLLMDKLAANQGFHIILYEDFAYVSASFFVQQLKIGLEIDDRQNVYIVG